VSLKVLIKAIDGVAIVAADKYIVGRCKDLSLSVCARAAGSGPVSIS
jgi:hypothetical protein